MELLSIKDTVTSEAFLSLCEDIEMPDAVIKVLIDNFTTFDFAPVTEAFYKLFSIETGKESSRYISEYCQNKQDGLLALTVYLTAAVIIRENYKNYGISEDIFRDTFKIFTRFVNEHLVSYNKYGFDRGWWIYRNLSCSLFRLGELEFEMKILADDEGDNGEFKKGDSVISVHIPSDAVLTRQETERSYKTAVAFFDKHFNSFKYKAIVCHSWLLSPALKELLSDSSNILNFQNDYKIINYDNEENSFMEWVYKKRYDGVDYNMLPENTSLERNIKKHLLKGGFIGCAFGVKI